MSHLLMFYGTECPHCHTMMPLLDRLQTEEGLTVERLESWHDDANAKLLTSYDDGSKCGGVPFLINTKTNKWLCGSVGYEELKAWALN